MVHYPIDVCHAEAGNSLADLRFETGKELRERQTPTGVGKAIYCLLVLGTPLNNSITHWLS